MSHNQIRISISGAIVIPSQVVANMSEDEKSEPASLLKIKVYVEDP